ncbi:MAG: hypothetical protein QW468_04315 [Candidatus Bathyarchaeia archaeon]
MARKLGDYRMPSETKKIAVYGQGRIKVPVKQRYWIKRKDGIKQRYWKKTRKVKWVDVDNVRFEFYGTGKEIYKAVRRALKPEDPRIPKGFVSVSATKFLENVDKYSFEGEWIEKEVGY